MPVSDFNHDGKVSFLDFQFMLDNWNPAGAHVPTPGVPDLLAESDTGIFNYHNLS